MNNFAPLIINIDSTEISSYEEDLISNELIGGIILFKHNYANKRQIMRLIDDVKKINNRVLICVDHEGGRVQRFINEFTKIPSFYSIGKAYEADKTLGADLAYSCGYASGYELKSIGIDINFSPVIDLSSNSEVLNERTFSSIPQKVSVLASKYITGLIENGIIPVVKHYPGHGLVSSDTHTDIASCDLSLKEVDMHLSVFRDIVNHFNIPIMTSHIKFNHIDSEPVTTSSKWLQIISKENFNNKAFFISDDLEMSGISKNYKNLSKVDILNRAISSGCGMVIVTTMQAKTIINNKASYKYYLNEYLDKMQRDNFIDNNINLPCYENIIYNKGNMSSYKNALNNISKYSEI